MSWKRARKPEHKQIRRQAILDAAAALLMENRAEDVSLNAIARHSGLSKSNLYRYFGSREAVLLSILRDDIAEWIADMTSKVGGLGPEADATEIGTLLADCLVSRPRLIMLAGQLTSVIERNVSADDLLSFKLDIKASASQSAQAIAKAIPGLSPEDAHKLGFYQLVLLQGLWPLAHPPEVMQEVMTHPELAGMHVSFYDALRDALTAILRGMLVGP
jgi:AcrR family transcriptional regulator